MNNFIFDVPTKVIFGKENLSALASQIAMFGKRVLMLYGKDSIKKNGLYDKIVLELNGANIFFVELPGVKPNPSITSVREGIRLVREHHLDFILAVGGGSTIDCAKAISAGVHYDGDAWDFFVTKTASVNNPTPIGTILTLAATGSEMNSGCVISNEETQEKLAFMHPLLTPKFTFEDPTLTFSVPQYHTAAGCADIFSHLLEQYFSSHDDEGLPDRMIEALMSNDIHYGKIVIAEPNNYDARSNIMWTSSLALNGMMSNGRMANDWSTHMIEHEVSAIYDVTHGAGLAMIHPNTLAYYLKKDLEQNLPLVKFINIGKNVFHLTGTDLEISKQTITEIRKFFNNLGMPATLRDEKIPEDKIEHMAKQAVRRGDLGFYHKINYDGALEILKNSF